MSATSIRTAAYRRSLARDYVMSRLTEDQAYTHDVDSIVMDLAASDGTDYEFTAAEWAQLIAPHEFDERGITDAALLKALANSQTGWVAMTRTPDGDVQSFNVELSGGDTPEAVEATLRKFIRYPEGTSITVLPLVG